MYAEQTTLNPIQLHLLEMFNHCDSEKMMLELKEVLAEFYAKQVQEEADRLWDEGTLNGEAIERILDEHWRTPYLDYIKICLIHRQAGLIPTKNPAQTSTINP